MKRKGFLSAEGLRGSHSISYVDRKSSSATSNKSKRVLRV